MPIEMTAEHFDQLRDLQLSINNLPSTLSKKRADAILYDITAEMEELLKPYVEKYQLDYDCFDYVEVFEDRPNFMYLYFFAQDGGEWDADLIRME